MEYNKYVEIMLDCIFCMDIT